VAPFSLLVPVVGMAAAWLLRGEAISWQQAAAAALILAGMAATVIRKKEQPEERAPRVEAWTTSYGP
jgi:O-acetylserine/cysteine efflux transporter